MSQHHRDPLVAKILREARPRIAASLPQACIRCGRPVTADQRWDVGHRVDLAKGGDPHDVGAEHRGENRRAGGKAGAAITRARRRTGTGNDSRLPTW